MSRRTWNLEELSRAVKESVSVAGVCRLVGLRPVGGNYLTMKRAIAVAGLDTRHFTGQLWSKGRYLVETPKCKSTTRSRLLRIRGHLCESCGLGSWMGKPIMIEMDHIDGNRLNNSETNLRLLCPNCHAQTPTWRNTRRP